MLRPFKLIPKVKYSFFIFLALVLLLGHVGLVAAYAVQRETVPFGVFAAESLKNGNLYNMGISFLAGAIYPVFMEFLETRQNRFRGLKLSIAVGSFVLIVFYALLFATSVGKTDYVSLFLQVVCYTVSLFLTIYLFLAQHLDQDYDNYADMDDRRRDELSATAHTPSHPTGGIKI